MLGSILDRMRGDRHPTGATGSAAAVEAHQGAPRPSSEPADRHESDSVPDLGSLSADELQTLLWERIAARCEELSGIAKASGLSQDHLDVLDAIARPGHAVIQQPPAAAQAVLTLLGKRNWGQAELIQRIEKDPALSQSLLKHANSAFYASKHGEPVVSIRGAVQRIGSTGVHATVMSQVMRGQLSRPGSGLDPMVSMAWDHMVSAAPLARSLARTFRADPEGSFTIGLLHDVGKLVFFSQVADVRKSKRRGLGLSTGFVGRALSELHEALGGVAALQWNLDPSTAWVIAHHHRRPIPTGPSRMGELIFIVERAELAARNHRPLDLEKIWADFELTTDIEKVRPWLKACGALGDHEGEGLAEAS